MCGDLRADFNGSLLSADHAARLSLRQKALAKLRMKTFSSPSEGKSFLAMKSCFRSCRLFLLREKSPA